MLALSLMRVWNSALMTEELLCLVKEDVSVLWNARTIGTVVLTTFPLAQPKARGKIIRDCLACGTALENAGVRDPLRTSRLHGSRMAKATSRCLRTSKHHSCVDKETMSWSHWPPPVPGLHLASAGWAMIESYAYGTCSTPPCESASSSKIDIPLVYGPQHGD